MLPRGESYDELYQAFRWDVPARYNMALDVCDRHAGDGSREALIYLDGAGRETRYSFLQLKRLSSQFAHVIVAYGIKKGDRVAILRQSSSHPMFFRAGCISCGTSSVRTKAASWAWQRAHAAMWTSQTWCSSGVSARSWNAATISASGHSPSGVAWLRRPRARARSNRVSSATVRSFGTASFIW